MLTNITLVTHYYLILFRCCRKITSCCSNHMQRGLVLFKEISCLIAEVEWCTGITAGSDAYVIYTATVTLQGETSYVQSFI